MSRIMLSSVAAVAMLASVQGASAQTEIQWWHAMGGALGVYTINDGDVAKALVGMGVDCIITDAPDVILAALG